VNRTQLLKMSDIATETMEIFLKLFYVKFGKQLQVELPRNLLLAEHLNEHVHLQQSVRKCMKRFIHCITSPRVWSTCANLQKFDLNAFSLMSVLDAN